jgi:predicted nucleic acid-binding protein
MARVFLDTNVLIDLAEKRKDLDSNINGEKLFLSPLSVHILFYVTKRKIPYPTILDIVSSLSLVPLDEVICYKALEGPTNDFEDNVQLHSAAEADCDVFLTSDKKLLGMKFFGKTRIASSLE